MQLLHSDPNPRRAVIRRLLLHLMMTLYAGATMAEDIDLVIPDMNGYYVWSSNWKSSEAGVGAIIFDAKAINSIFIGFASEPSNEAGLYEIEIGGWSNKKTVIRKGSHRANGAQMAESRDRKAMVVPRQWATYWVSVDRGKVRVGRGHQVGKSVVLEWQDSEPNNELGWFGFSSHEVILFKNIRILGPHYNN